MILEGENGNRYAVGKKIGEGGQGAVWTVASDRYCVIKTLMDTSASSSGSKDGIQDYDQGRIVYDEARYEKFARKIKSLIAIGVLSDIDRVALPEEVLKKPCCGYTMRLMDGLESIKKQMIHSDEYAISHSGKNSSLKKKLSVLKCLADIMRKLHGRGLVYCDLSPENVFISQNPNDREVWLIDSDNLVYANSSKKCIGTPNYRAPEIYRNEQACSFYSDMYSFALIAFEYLTAARPFSDENLSDEGGWDDVSASDDWGAGEVDAIENGDVDYGYEYSDVYMGVPLSFVATEKMRRLFYRTFCAGGRKKPQTRPNANEWYEAIDEACNLVCECPREHTFLGPDCAWCRLKKHKNPDMKIYALRMCIPLPGEDYDWENTLPPKLSEYKCAERYLYQSKNQQIIKIPADTFTLQDCDGSVRVTLKDAGIMFNDNDCRFNNIKLYQVKDGKPVACTKYPTLAIGDKYNIVADISGGKRGEQRAYTQIVLERLR